MAKAEQDTCIFELPNETAKTTVNLEMEKQLLAALLEAEKRKNQQDAVNIMQELWDFYSPLDQDEQAEKFARLGIAKLESMPEAVNQLADFYIQFSSTLSHLGLFDEDHALLSRGLKLPKDKIDIDLYGTFFYNKAFTYGATGETDVSLRFYELAMAAFQEFEPPIKLKAQVCEFDATNPSIYIATTLTQMGAQYAIKGELEKAQNYQQCAVKIFESTNRYHKIPAATELAKTLYALGNYQAAIDIAEQVLRNKNARARQLIDSLSLVLANQIRTANQQELEHFAANLLSANRTKIQQGSFCSLSQSMFSLEKLFSQSMNFYTLDVENTENFQHPVKIIEIYRLLIILHSRLKQDEVADILAKKALTIIQKYQYKLGNPLAWQSAQFALMETYLDAFAQDPPELPEQQKYKIINLLEKYYSISPQREKNLYLPLTSSDSALEEKYTNWLENEKALQQSTNADPELRHAVDLARDVFLSNNSKTQHNEIVLPFKALQQVQTNIPQDTLMLRYVLTELNSFMLAISTNEIQYFALPAKSVIEEAVYKHSINLKQSKVDDASTQGTLEKIFPFKKPDLSQWKKLVLVTDGALNKYPFASINVGLNENVSVPLINYVEIVKAHSANLYFQQQLSATAKKSVPVYAISVFANPSFEYLAAEPTNTGDNILAIRGGTYKNLYASEMEAESIVKAFPNLDISVATKDAATNAFLLDSTTRSSTILHIATHGYVNANIPEIVGLITAPDKLKQNSIGFLSLSELLSKPVDSQLVVISGCETMIGVNYNGSGMRSMTRGFLSQGAGSVIGTLWPVQDRATALFMASFYKNLAHLKNTSAALQKTQISFAKQGAYRHPKYWAGFVLTVANRKHEQINLN